MSLIGKKVVATKFSEYNVEGTVLDKILGVILVSERTPSGKGGTVEVDKYVNVDMYLIETESGKIETVKCSDILYIK